MIKVDAKAIQLGTGCTPAKANAYLELIVGAAAKYEINTIRRFAGWLANIGIESDGLEAGREGMNYSAKRLAVVWKNRYANADGTPNALALSLSGNPEKIANNVYANRLGNGPESSGDGWRYRGTGWIQTTGKTNIVSAFKALGLPEDSDPNVLIQPKEASLSAAVFWKAHGCNELLDKDMFSASVKVVNGAPPNDENKGKQRFANYRACVAYLKTINQ